MQQKLSKYLFREFHQCPDRFWLRINEEKEESALEIKTPDAFQQYFKAQKDTLEQYALELLKQKGDRSFEFQKEFETENLRVRVDIYEKHETLGKTGIYEVYNSKSFKNHQLWDLAFMTYVLQQAGEPVTKIFAIYINANYSYTGGEIDPEKLLCIEDLTQKTKRLLPKIEKKVNEALAYAATNPIMTADSHSCKSKDCSALRRFHPEPTAGSVFEYRGIDRDTFQKLLKEGVTMLSEIPETYIKTEQQRRQVALAKTQTLLIDEPALEKWINDLNYPLYFLDYEAITSSIPVYEQTHPFQHVVFQYSLHVIPELNAPVVHYEFLAEGKKLPTADLLAALASQLKDDKGTILVWHDSFEKARNREMAAHCPEYSDWLLRINARIVDMEKVFNADEGIYLHPDFRGKSSVKTVLPVLLPEEASYADLDIDDGMLAAILWFKYLTEGGVEDMSPALLRKQLLDYCGLDTFAMVKILELLMVKV